jgi:hypothetical protein
MTRILKLVFLQRCADLQGPLPAATPSQSAHTISLGLEAQLEATITVTF